MLIIVGEGGGADTAGFSNLKGVSPVGGGPVTRGEGGFCVEDCIGGAAGVGGAAFGIAAGVVAGGRGANPRAGLGETLPGERSRTVLGGARCLEGVASGASFAPGGGPGGGGGLVGGALRARDAEGGAGDFALLASKDGSNLLATGSPIGLGGPEGGAPKPPIGGGGPARGGAPALGARSPPDAAPRCCLAFNFSNSSLRFLTVSTFSVALIFFAGGATGCMGDTIGFAGFILSALEFAANIYK